MNREQRRIRELEKIKQEYARHIKEIQEKEHRVEQQIQEQKKRINKIPPGPEDFSTYAEYIQFLGGEE